MLDKFRKYYEQQISLAQTQNKPLTIELYKQKLQDLNDMVHLQESGLSTQELLEQISQKEHTYLFIDGCTFEHFLHWLPTIYPTIFEKNLLQLQTVAGVITYLEAYALFTNSKVYIEPVYRTVNLIELDGQIIGSLFFDNIDLYHLCTISTKEYDIALEQMYDDYRVDY